MKKAICYTRVSTKQQKESGLSLDAQKKDCKALAKKRDYKIIACFEEIESGKNDARKELQQALNLCREENAILIISRLDRLARNAAFLMRLQDSDVDFVCCDMEGANKFTVGVMALLAQQERELISARTKAALKTLKDKGVKLGSPKPISEETRAKAHKARHNQAMEFYRDIQDTVLIYRRDGFSYREIAEKLNDAGKRTQADKPHTAMSVRRLVLRLEDAGITAPIPKKAKPEPITSDDTPKKKKQAVVQNNMTITAPAKKASSDQFTLEDSYGYVQDNGSYSEHKIQKHKIMLY